MSESNVPSNYPSQSDADTIDWDNPFAELADSLHSQDDRSLEELFFEAELAPAAEEPLAELKDFPTQIPPRPASPSPIAAIAAWSEAPPEPADVDVTDLISLIQELNQCNSILLDRVSQLEEALESSQVALQAEVGRSQDGAEPLADPSAPPEAIVSLFNQLEFAHQANQRQQILIETLTGQLESSQERVAELERESALIQQRYSEQVQVLAQTESSNRDLQARLHRQQRYTLQFKTALEKCLEVPTPQYDLGAEAMAEAIMGDNPFLLKTQKIQPWSAQTDTIQTDAIAPPWMKLSGLIELDGLKEDAIEPEASPLAPISSGVAVSSSKLPLAELPSLETDLPSLDAVSSIPAQDLLVQQQIMQILPDLLAIERSEVSHELSREANLDTTDLDTTDLDTTSSDNKREAIAALPNFEALPQTVMAVPPVEPAAKAEMQSAVPEGVKPDVMSSSPQDVGLDSAEGEDALWQDLARLIEVSTEDMVRASLSGDFSAFESINFDALPHNEPMPVLLQSIQIQPSTAQHSPAQPIQSQPSQAQPSQVQPSQADLRSAAASELQDIEVPLDLKEPDAETEEKSFIPALSQPSWPSPVVYPLRSTKKPRSSGVDLPSFLRPGADPLPT